MLGIDHLRNTLEGSGRLRTKIEVDSSNAPQLLITMRGLGYKLVRVAEE